MDKKAKVLGKKMDTKTKVVLVCVVAAGGAVLAFLLLRKKAGAAPPPPPAGLANLYGQVTDSVTGKAVPGVLVTLDSQQVSTDTGGNYVFTNLQPGTYIVTFSKPGYETLVR